MPHGEFCWNELNTRNVEKAKAFYGDTIGWLFEDLPMPGDPPYTYVMCRFGGKPVAGIFEMNDPMSKDVPDCWLAYLEVDDIDARVEKARIAGATVVREPRDIPNVGRIALLNEPTGAVVAWMTTDRLIDREA